MNWRVGERFEMNIYGKHFDLQPGTSSYGADPDEWLIAEKCGDVDSYYPSFKTQADFSSGHGTGSQWTLSQVNTGSKGQALSRGTTYEVCYRTPG